MNRIASILLATGVTLSGAPVEAFEPTVEVGVGLPELTHLRLGGLILPRLGVELYVGNVVFNWLTGISVSGFLLGGEAEPDGPPRHSLLLQGTFAFNPLANPVRIRGGGETIASAALAEGGYALTTKSGFTFHAALGAFVYVEESITAAPNVSLSVGWKF